jgi:signal transduction histidine kinase
VPNIPSVVESAPDAAERRLKPERAEAGDPAMAALAELGRSRQFWKARAEMLAADLKRARQTADDERAERRLGDEAIGAVMRLRPRDLAAGIGRVIARLGPFDGFVVALRENGELKAAASSLPEGSPALEGPLDAHSAMHDSLGRGTSILRVASGARAAVYDEDRLFVLGGFAAYLCVPFEAGAVALASRVEIDGAVRERVERIVARLVPAIGAQVLRREAAARRALAQGLALRLFGAIDAERAAIARGLHDDQAQLLAAVGIALKGRRAAALKIFHELERELRTRLRALRPASLKRMSLRAALEAELRRLAASGIRGSVSGIGAARTLPRPIANVCYQVAREAVSNVIRHSHAKEVSISLARDGDLARLVIVDDGRGLRGGGGARGMGLGGLAERLALLGGTLRIESRPGRTRLAAEIPVTTR